MWNVIISLTIQLGLVDLDILLYLTGKIHIIVKSRQDKAEPRVSLSKPVSRDQDYRRVWGSRYSVWCAHLGCAFFFSWKRFITRDAVVLPFVQVREWTYSSYISRATQRLQSGPVSTIMYSYLMLSNCTMQILVYLIWTIQ